MIDGVNQGSPDHERLSHDGNNDVMPGHIGVDPQLGHSPNVDDTHEDSVLKDRYRVEIESLCTSYSLAQKEISLLNIELAKARQALEEQSLQAEQAIKEERLERGEEVRNIKEQAAKTLEECQKHMLDPKMKAMFRKYLRLSNPSQGVTFARYLCPGPGHRDFFSLGKRSKSKKCNHVLNEIRLQGRTKILYAKHQSLLVKHKDACNHINHLKALLQKKYQKEFDSINKELEGYSMHINKLVETIECLKDEKDFLSLKLSQERTQGKELERRIEDLKISERLITNKYKSITRDIEEQNSKDVEMKMFLQSCLYAMKKSGQAHHNTKGKLPVSFGQYSKTLLEKVEASHGGIDIKNLSTSDVHAFVSLLVQRMN